MDPAILPDITTTYEHMQKSDGTVGMVEKASSGRMSPIRKRSVKDVEQHIETLEKENFDLKLRIYFLEQQKGINKDDTLKVNIDLRVQLQSIHEQFQKKQDTWEQMMAGYENHIEELEQQVHKDRSSQVSLELHSLKERLEQSQNSLHEMEQLLHEKAFESETQLQAANADIEKLKQQLADRERQLTTSPSQDVSRNEDLLALKHALDEREVELVDKSLLLQTVNQQVHELEHQLKQVAAKMTETSQSLSEREAAVADRDRVIDEKERQLHAVRDELTQRDFSLKKAQIDLQAAARGSDSDIEKVRADLTREFTTETNSILSELESTRQALYTRDRALRCKDEELSARDSTMKDLNNEINNLKQQLQLSQDKYNKDLSNLQLQIQQLEANLQSKDLEIKKLEQRFELEGRSDKDSLNQLRAALEEKDRTIASLLESVKHKDSLLSLSADRPYCTSSPREDTNPAISRLCVEIAELKKENAALKEGRPMDLSDSDIDIDGLSDSSEARDVLHAQLAKHNARAQMLQAKLLEMSREDVDGGSDSSCLLREQISALMRMRESDKRVIDALKKHISTNCSGGGDFDPEVVSTLAADVYRLSGKIKEMHRSGMRSSRSTGSRSQRSGASSSSSVYREEIEQLKRELDSARHEASKTKAELHKLCDESAVVIKLQSTESLVRQQAEEKKRLMEQIAYYKSLLEAAGLLPRSPIDRHSSVGNLSSAAAEKEELAVSRKRASSEERKAPSSLDADDVDLGDHVRAMQFRQRNFTPDRIRDVMEQLGSNIPVVSHAAPSNHSRIPVIDQSAVRGETSPWHSQEPQLESKEDVRAIVEQYREEVQTFGRPVELKKQLEELGTELHEAQDKLNQSLEQNHQLEESYESKLLEKDAYIDDLEEKIRQLQAQLRALYAGDMSGSMTIELAGSRPPSSIHSVPGEMTSSRVVSLNGTTVHDRSTSGVVVDRSTLSFSGSALRPGSISPFDNANVTLDSISKSADESGISRGGSRPSSGLSSARSQSEPTTHSTATVVAEEVGSRATIYSTRDDLEGGEVITKGLSPLTEVSSALSRGSDTNRDSGLDTMQRSKRGGDVVRSAASLVDSLDGTTERVRRDDSMRYNDVPSLGGTLLPNDALQTQENLLNTSTESINKLAMEPHTRQLYSTTSPEKGQLHSPVVSQNSLAPQQRADVKHQPVTTERSEKKTSPSRQLFPNPQSSSDWEQAANEAFPKQLHSIGQLPDRPHSASTSQPLMSGGRAHRPHSAHTAGVGGQDVLLERPLSSASTQTDREDFAELGDRLVQALNKEDTLKEQRGHLGEIHKEYEEALRRAQEEADDLRTETETHLSKRLETAQLANDLQQQYTTQKFPDEFTLLQKSNTLQMVRQQYEEELMTSADKVRQLTEELEKATDNSNQVSKELKKSQVELRAVSESLIDTSKRYKEATKQLREAKIDLEEKGRCGEEARQRAVEVSTALDQSQRELRASQAELRMSREALADKTGIQVALTKELKKVESEKDELGERVERLQMLAQQLLPADGQVESTPTVAPKHSRSGSLHHPASVRRLQDEITSILDTSEHIKTNLASALQQSVLSDSHHAEGDITLVTDKPLTDNNLIELLKLNLHRVETLNARITELLDVERQALHAVKSVQNSPKKGSAGRKPSSTHLVPMGDSGATKSPDEEAVGKTVSSPDYGVERLNRSQNNAADRSLSNDISMASESGAPELVTINGITYQQVPAVMRYSPLPAHQSADVTTEGRQMGVPTWSVGEHASSAPSYMQLPDAVQRSSHAQPNMSVDAVDRSLDNQQHSRDTLSFQQAPVSCGQASVCYGQTSQAPVSYRQASQAPESYGQTLQAPVSYAQISQAPVSYRQASQAPESYGQTLQAPVSYGQTSQAPVSYGQASQAPASYGQASQAAATQGQLLITDAHWNVPVSLRDADGYSSKHVQPAMTSSLPTARQHMVGSESGYYPSPVLPENTEQLSSAAVPQSRYRSSSVPAATAVTQPPVHTSTPVMAESAPTPAPTAARHLSPSRLPLRDTSPTRPSARQMSPTHTSVRHGSPSRPSVRHESPSQGYQNSEEYSPPLKQSHLPPATQFYEPTSMSEAYQTLQPIERPLQDNRQLSNLPSPDDLPSTRGPLYAISDLINYELLKKQNEESLVLLSGLEALIQGRLDGFTSASPLQDMEWCTLKELKSTAENLRATLFAEKKYITSFYIQELPNATGQKYEEMLRAYKKLESRYDWAKSQLMELMKATKFDESLVSQMKRVKSILKASKENLKTKKYTAERLRQKPV